MNLLKRAFLEVYYFLFLLIIRKPKVLDIDQSINYLLEHRASLARFGDGELTWAIGENRKHFNQKVSSAFSEELKSVLEHPSSNLLIGLQRSAFYGLKDVTLSNRLEWQKIILKSGMKWQKIIPRDATYLDTNITRPYMDQLNKGDAERRFSQLKKVWDSRNLLIVEGEHTRFGVGNDLLDGANSVRRIEAPSENAFDYIDSIQNDVEKNYHEDDLVLLALGPTATILANRLAQQGIQSIDIGHTDIEYEWFLLKTEARVPISGKYVNEAGKAFTEFDTINLQKYQNEIVEYVVIHD